MPAIVFLNILPIISQRLFKMKKVVQNQFSVKTIVISIGEKLSIPWSLSD